MTIKTCEEYVLNELKNEQDKFERLLDDYTDLSHLNDRLADDLKTLKMLIKHIVHTIDDNGKETFIFNVVKDDEYARFNGINAYDVLRDIFYDNLCEKEATQHAE